MQQATSVARIAYVPMMPYNSLAYLLYVSTHQPIKRQNPFLSVLTLTSSTSLVSRDCRLKIPTRIYEDGSEVPFRKSITGLTCLPVTLGVLEII